MPPTAQSSQRRSTPSSSCTPTRPCATPTSQTSSRARTRTRPARPSAPAAGFGACGRCRSSSHPPPSSSSPPTGSPSAQNGGSHRSSRPSPASTASSSPTNGPSSTSASRAACPGPRSASPGAKRTARTRSWASSGCACPPSTESAPAPRSCASRRRSSSGPTTRASSRGAPPSTIIARPPLSPTRATTTTSRRRTSRRSSRPRRAISPTVPTSAPSRSPSSRSVWACSRRTSRCTPPLRQASAPPCLSSRSVRRPRPLTPPCSACSPASTAVALFLRTHSSTSTKLFVGGYVSRGSRINTYCRTTRLSPHEHHLLLLSRLQEVIVHSFGFTFARPLSSLSSSSSSSPYPSGTPSSSPSPAGTASSRHSLIFFEPPCTVRIARASRTALERMGYLAAVLPARGFRLAGAGEARSVSFLGHESFTVHFGVCAVELAAGGCAQRAQLWATATFDGGWEDLDSLLVAGKGAGRDDGDDEGGACGVQSQAGRLGTDVCPDESMLVQHWKGHRRAFGTASREVRLAFSYPCQLAEDTVSERGMSEVYELDITFRGYYRRAARRRYKSSATSYTVGSVADSRVRSD
ncbi:hypothetical protein BC628DRAFT_119202 [Trametes gibbosa]|nr:hypothetical protein BC628DRAFT_119202 [Trametes gibbosa]